MSDTLKTAYIVLQGEYSDRHIIAVFSNRESAINFVEKVKKSSYSYCHTDPYIQEFSIDKPYDVDYRPYFEVCVHNNGIVSYTSEGISPYIKTDSVYYDELCYYKQRLNQIKHDPDNYCDYWIVVRAESEEQAAKIAQDKIAQYRAEQEGLT